MSTAAGAPRLRSPIRVRLLAACLLMLSAACTRTDETADWPQWRGPEGAGVSIARSPATEWDEHRNVRWKTELPGRGNSSPIVVGDRVYLTSSVPKPPAPDQPTQETKVVVALDPATGKQLWHTEIATRPREKLHRRNSSAAPTPTADASGVFAYFGADLVHVDRLGTIVWNQVVDPTYGATSRYGAAASPLLFDDMVIVIQDQEYANDGDTGWMAAYGRDSGEQVWRTEWDFTCCSYSTPLLISRDGRPELVIGHSGALMGYDPQDGQRLWQHDIPALQMVSTPIYHEGVVYLLGGADHNRANVAVRLSGSGGETTTEQLWLNQRLVPQASSAVLHRGRLFAATLQGVAVAFDPSTGDPIWQERLPFGRVQASVLAVGDHVFVTSQSGAVAVLASGPSPSLVAVNEVDEGNNTATPAIGAGCLLLRTRSHLYCIAADESAA